MNDSIINDFAPETTSLINRLIAAGWTILSSHNGEDRETFTTVEKTVEHLTSVDDSHLNVQAPDGKKYQLYLVFGNSPGELVCDYSFPRSGDLLEPIAQAHSDEWTGKDQPKTTLFKKYPNLAPATV